MVRGLVGFAGFFVLFLVGMKVIGFLIGGVIGLVFNVLWFAFLGWLIYLVIKVVSPSTAQNIRDTVRGRSSEA
ncbi:MAG: hypothetical protein ACYC2K_01955 [Gemmatimonadales bacterium]